MNDRLLELRKALKLTQEEFGEKIGLSRSMMCMLEQNTKPITERTILIICAKFKVNEQWLRNGTGSMFIEYDLKYERFYKVYSKLSEPLQDYLLSCAIELLKTQENL